MIDFEQLNKAVCRPAFLHIPAPQQKEQPIGVDLEMALGQEGAKPFGKGLVNHPVFNWRET